MVNQVFHVFQDAVYSKCSVLETKHADVLLHTLTHTALQLFSTLHCNSSVLEGRKSTKLHTAWISSSTLHAVWNMKTISKSLSNYPVYNVNFTVYSLNYRSVSDATLQDPAVRHLRRKMYSSTRVLEYY